jgi:hypothetical protein
MITCPVSDRGLHSQLAAEVIDVNVCLQLHLDCIVISEMRKAAAHAMSQWLSLAHL